MAQDLFYTPASSSLVLIRSTDPSPYYWYDITSLQISGSAYDATISGSEFGGTAATARIYAYSGSVQVVSFPLEDTNLFYPPFPFPTSIADYYFETLPTESFSTTYFDFILDPSIPSAQLSGSGISIYDLTTSSSYISITGSATNGAVPLISGNSYLFAVSGSGSYSAYMSLEDITSGSTIFNLSASNAYVSASYTLQEFHNYSITFYIVSSSGDLYLADQYAQCIDCSVISSNVLVQSTVGILSLSSYYLGDDGYGYQILSPGSGSAVTTISDATSYPSCSAVPCP